jgi:hypothetical protein
MKLHTAETSNRGDIDPKVKFAVNEIYEQLAEFFWHTVPLQHRLGKYPTGKKTRQWSRKLVERHIGPLHYARLVNPWDEWRKRYFSSSFLSAKNKRLFTYYHTYHDWRATFTGQRRIQFDDEITRRFHLIEIIPTWWRGHTSWPQHRSKDNKQAVRLCVALRP